MRVRRGIQVQSKSTVSAELVVLTSTGVQLEGFRRAVQRLRAAVETNDENGVYVSVMEALNWLPVFVGSDLREHGDIGALLYARHRGSHQQASVIYHEEGDVWRWRPAASLPMPPKDDQRHHHPKLRAKYECLLEREPVLDVFDRLPPPLRP